MGVRFSCPQCGMEVEVVAVQGERCPSCNFEYKRFGAGEGQTARDYFAVLTGLKHLLQLPEGQGWIIAHE
jgi:DNA-directed RNA polymerase subunit RPC12/RpoP